MTPGRVALTNTRAVMHPRTTTRSVLVTTSKNQASPRSQLSTGGVTRGPKTDQGIVSLLQHDETAATRSDASHDAVDRGEPWRLPGDAHYIHVIAVFDSSPFFLR